LIIYYTDNYTGGREESHRLLGKALAAYTGDEQRAKTLIGALKKGEHGKPYIEGFSCFSISHTGGIWAVLFADCSECGLDIQLRKECDFRAIARRWFTTEDAALVSSIDNDAEACDLFFRIWARREALVKAAGGSVAGTDFPAVNGDAAVFRDTEYIIADVGIPGAGLYAAVCSDGIQMPVRTVEL
jgi:hypothetical protein